MNITAPSHITMLDEDFLRMRDLIHGHCGIMLPESLKFVAERRLRPRLDFANLSSFSAYYRSIKYAHNPTAELEEIVDLITTNETYFFREPRQLECFIQEIVPDLMRQRDVHLPLRIWSAGCASGEEPFTLAMLFKEMGAAMPAALDIFGSDISRKVLRQARQGIYREHSFRETSTARRQRFFVPKGREWALRDDIRKMVTFGQVNLVDEAALNFLSNVDVIFCRNVLIYFSKESRARLLDSFFRKLRPGGYLLLGHSETLLSTDTAFEVAALNRDIVYRKPSDGAAPAATHAPRLPTDRR
jgi:chemotaxis protein methyltransferase CheR